MHKTGLFIRGLNTDSIAKGNTENPVLGRLWFFLLLFGHFLLLLFGHFLLAAKAWPSDPKGFFSKVASVYIVYSDKHKTVGLNWGEVIADSMQSVGPCNGIIWPISEARSDGIALALDRLPSLARPVFMSRAPSLRVQVCLPTRNAEARWLVFQLVWESNQGIDPIRPSTKLASKFCKSHPGIPGSGTFLLQQTTPMPTTFKNAPMSVPIVLLHHSNPPPRHTWILFCGETTCKVEEQRAKHQRIESQNMCTRTLAEVQLCRSTGHH